jgi:hypothetical protein
MGFFTTKRHFFKNASVATLKLATCGKLRQGWKRLRQVIEIDCFTWLCPVFDDLL